MTGPLLDHLRRHANPHGLVLARESRLVDELGGTPEDLSAALQSLEASDAVKILSGPPYIALKLLKWSGSSSPRVRNEQQISSNPGSVHIEVPVSSRAAAATQLEDGGAGEGEALLDQVLAVLGPEADREEFRAILTGHQPALIHRCLRRVEATKAVRVSRAALFRSLLQKLSR